MILRDHEADERMWREVHDENEYRVPKDMTGWNVLDIGGNIGSFAALCIERGARVTSVEPALDNLEQLRKNAPDAHRIHAACGASTKTAKLYVEHGDPSGYRLAEHGVEVQQIAFPEILAQHLERWIEKRVSFLKIDAEGAEYPILRVCDLGLIDRVAIEFHGAYGGGPIEAELLRKKLNKSFNELEWRECHQKYGWIRIYRGER